MTVFADPFELRVLKALTASLQQITPANGYVFDLSSFNPGDGVTTSRVYRGITWFGESHPIPMLSILEGANPADEVAEPPIVTAGGEVDWDLMVQGWVDDDPQNPTDPARVLLADVRRRLAYEAARRLVNDPTERDIFGLRGDWEATNPGETYGSRNRLTGLRFGAGVVRPADEVSSRAWFWLTVTPRIFVNPAFPYA